MSDPLQDALRTYVANARRDPGNQAACEADQLFRSGEFYLDSGGILCVKARSASLSRMGRGGGGETGFVQLPTRISASANVTLVGLRELFNVGLITAAGYALHEADPGVTLQVIP